MQILNQIKLQIIYLDYILLIFYIKQIKLSSTFPTTVKSLSQIRLKFKIPFKISLKYFVKFFKKEVIFRTFKFLLQDF